MRDTDPNNKNFEIELQAIEIKRQLLLKEKGNSDKRKLQNSKSVKIVKYPAYFQEI